MLPYAIALLSIGGIYLLLAQSLNLQYGFMGLANFGVAGFYALGAYTSALLALAGWPIALSLTAAAVMAGAMGILIGTVCLKLRPDYLGIVTLSFSEIVRITLVSEDGLTNGVRGLSNIPPISLGGLSTQAGFLVAVILANIVVALVFRRIVRSPFGRSIQAIRDDEVAVEAIGKAPLSFKRRIMTLGAAIMGLAGGLYAHYIGYISPDQFHPITTFYVWIAVIVGGAGRLKGAWLGTLVLTLFLEGSRFLRDVVPGISEVEMASVRIAAIGLALMLMTVLRPQGLAGDFKSK